jgi:hypothetical protein
MQPGPAEQPIERGPVLRIARTMANDDVLDEPALEADGRLHRQDGPGA